MNKPVNILIVDDSEDDAKLVLRALRRGGFDPAHRRVQTAAEVEAALTQERWDAVISDFSMPGFTGIDALTIFRSTGLDIPFILISGTIGEETAVNAMKAGASDYIMKNSLARLAPVLERELNETHIHAAHRQAERELVQSEQRFSSAFNDAPIGVALVSPDGRWLKVNQALCDLVGYSEAELLKRTFQDITYPEDLETDLKNVHRVLAGEIRGYQMEKRYIHAHGHLIPILLNVSLVRDAQGQPSHFISQIQDITTRKQSEIRIKYLNRVYAMLSGINTLIVHVRNRDELYREACRIAVEEGGFRMSLITIVDPITQKLVPVASEGKDEELLSAIKDRLSSNENASSTMVAQAIREKQAVVSNNSHSDPKVVFGRQYAEAGVRSMAILPLMVADDAVGVLALYASEVEFFREEEMSLLGELTGNIAFALENIGREEKVVRLSRIQALMSGINAAIVRIRDHQALFNEACRIAVEQGHFRMAWIGAFDPATLDVTPRAWAGENSEVLTKAKSSAAEDSPRGKGSVGRAIRQRRPVFNNDLAVQGFGGPRLREIQRLGFRSQITLPLYREQEIVAVFTMYSDESNFFDEEERRQLTELAGNISFALENITTQQKLDKLARIRSVSSEINAIIIRIHDRDELLRETCRIANAHGKFDHVWVAAVDQIKQTVHAIAWTGFSAEAAHAVDWSSINAAKGTLGKAMLTRKPAVRNNIGVELPEGKLRREAVYKGCHSTASLPLVIDGNVVGLLGLFAPEAGFFDEEELILLTEVAGNVSFALGNIEKELKIARLSRIQAVMSSINAVLVHVRDRQTVFDEACRIAVELGGFGIAWIGALNTDTLEITPAACAGVDAESFLALNQSTVRSGVAEGQGVIGRAYREKRAAFSNDLAAEPDVGGKRRKEALRRGYHSTISLPLLVDGVVVGNLSLFARERGFFNLDELGLLNDLAANISLALDHIARQQKVEKLSRIRVLSGEINLLIVRVRDRQKLFGEVCRIATEYGKFGIAWIGVLDPQSLDVTPVACAGPGAVEFLHDYKASARSDDAKGQGIVGRAIRARKPVFSNDGLREPGRRNAAVALGYHSRIALPLWEAGDIIGIIVLFTTEPDFFMDDEIGLMSEVAGNVSFALDLIQKSAALEESEKKLDGILGTLQEVVWSMNAHSGRILYLNAAVEQMTGRAAGEFLAQPRLWRRLVHRDDRASMRGSTRRLLHEGSLTHEFRIVRAGGGIRAVECSARVRRDGAGEVLSIDGTIVDITERKQAEVRLIESERFARSTIDALTSSLCVIDEAGNINAVNKAWRDFAAANDAVPEGVGENVNYLEVCESAVGEHAAEGRVFAAGVRTVLSGATDEFMLEYACHGPHDQRWFVGRASRFHGVGPKRVAITHENITLRKQAEMTLLKLNEELEEKVVLRTVDLQRARREAEEANHAKSSFLATMSHEIRTPMNGVIGMVDVLHQSSLKGDQVEMVDLIRESAFSLLGIINDILDFSKIEAGKLELEREAFVVGDVVEGVCSMLNGMADKKDVALILYTDPAIPAHVLGDGPRLRQVLVNLVNNAIKFSSGQSQMGRVSVRALLVEQSAETVIVEIRVTDNGIGIDEETQARLFTAFTQADASTTRHFGGTGLGLAIANNMVELMGGEITVQSVAGAGSTFKVRLPFAWLPGNANTVEVASEVAGLCCVVVGDTGGLADDLAAYLKHAHADVERVPDLASAREQRADRSGLSVWVVDTGSEPQLPEHIRAVAHAEASQDVRFVVVLIERGKRRRPRMVAPDMITMDGNALNRRTFLKAVAVAAGRASLEVEEVKSAFGKFAVRAPSRVEALRQGRLILIAEDNETNQKVILRQLALLGYTADIAANGLKALECWRSGDYSLLLTDLHMPQMDGYELTQAIRADEKEGIHIPIIALTANALKGEAERCRAAGMDDYRSKPSPLEELKSVLDKWLPSAKPEPDAPILSPQSSIATQQAATEVPVNVSILEGLVGDDPDVVREFLQNFRSSASKIAAELRAACVTSQTDAAAAAAHKLKSSAHAVGASTLGELCAAMEEEGKAGNAEALTVLLPRFEAEMAVVEDYLDKLSCNSLPCLRHLNATAAYVVYSTDCRSKQGEAGNSR